MALGVTIISGYVSSYIAARPKIKAYKQTVTQMERNGASDEEIKAYMDRPIEDVTFDYKAILAWISIKIY